MATFLMTGKYAPTSMAGMSNQRTQQAIEVITKFGGEVKSMYATLGDNDLLFVLDLPGTNEAIKASVELSRLTGIGFSTSPAVSVEEFDKLMG